MKKVTIVLLFFIMSNLFGHLEDKEKELKKKTASGEKLGFNKGAIINLSLNQVNFQNWATGGNNSIAASTMINYFFYYKSENWVWDNYGSIGYGILDQENYSGIVKTDDKFEFTTKIGKKSINKLFYAILLNMKTQMAPGYVKPDDKNKISDLFAPIYVTSSIGMDYKKEDKLSLFATLLSSKMTFVLDQNIADMGGFGVDPAKYGDNGIRTKKGDNFKVEFGGYIKFHFRDEIFTNVQLISKVDLFSNYLENPQNIDIDCEFLLNMKINKFLSANISTYMIYDDDIAIADEDKPEKKAGPQLQFKEIIGLGISFTL